jgi:cytidylate kinase
MNAAIQVLTIDGPAGCGKSTVARRVAAAVGGIAFSTGRLYRAVTALAVERGASMNDTEQLLRLLIQYPVDVVERAGELRVRVAGRECGEELHGSGISRQVHWIADNPRVRLALLPVQRNVSATRPIIAEGRDMGSVVFPHAPAKVYLTASVEERAHRRLNELKSAHGEAVSLAQVCAEIAERDRLDSTRDTAPLREPAGAVVIDTTGMEISDVVAAVLALVPESWRLRSGGRPPA